MNFAPLWKCPKCGRLFANRKQSHFCSRYTLREHFAGKSPTAIALFRDFAKLVKRCGPSVECLKKRASHFKCE